MECGLRTGSWDVARLLTESESHGLVGPPLTHPFIHSFFYSYIVSTLFYESVVGRTPFQRQEELTHNTLKISLGQRGDGSQGSVQWSRKAGLPRPPVRGGHLPAVTTPGHLGTIYQGTKSKGFPDLPP